MSPLRIVIEAYGGLVQNVYVCCRAPENVIEPIVVDWDRQSPAAYDDSAARLVEVRGAPGFAVLSRPGIKPWHSLPAAGIQEWLERADLAAFGAEPRAERRASLPETPQFTPPAGELRRCGQ